MQAVQTLHAKAHPEVFRATLDAQLTTTFFAEVLAGEGNLVLVAEAEGAVIGYLWCQERLPEDSVYARAAHTAYINHVSVDPDHRRHGIGRALVEIAVAELKARNAVRIGVDFWSFNGPARSFFTRMGFCVQREVCSLSL